MKLAYVIFNEVYTQRVTELLKELNIDYFTRFEQVKGKGHGTDAHLGTRSFPNLNAVLMIAFEDETVMRTLAEKITASNSTTVKPDDRIRMFQVPLERIV
jgi:hypothetical protein